MLQLESVSKSYHGQKALNEVSLTLRPGEIVGLFGENGAGKTTLMNCILGFLHHEGSITLDGQPITRKNIARLSLATNLHSFFPNLSAAAHREFYQMQFPSFREKRFDGLMEFFELPMHKAARQLSTGQQNQLEVILALSQGADYILMDEPFAGNDIFNREDFYKVLSGILEPEETVILSTHLIEEIQNFIGRAVLLHKGQLIGDKTADELETEGKSLVQFVKESFHYRADRVSQALENFSSDDSPNA